MGRKKKKNQHYREQQQDNHNNKSKGKLLFESDDDNDNDENDSSDVENDNLITTTITSPTATATSSSSSSRTSTIANKHQQPKKKNMLNLRLLVSSSIMNNNNDNKSSSSLMTSPTAILASAESSSSLDDIHNNHMMKLPIVYLSDQDAKDIDVDDNDMVFVISKEVQQQNEGEQDNDIIKGIELCSVYSVMSSPSSSSGSQTKLKKNKSIFGGGSSSISSGSSIRSPPPSSSQKKKKKGSNKDAPNHIANGCCLITSPMAAKMLLSSNNNNNKNNNSDYMNQERIKTVESTTATTTTPTPSNNNKIISSPSPSKSKFSFAKGGGGDSLVTPSPSSSKQYHHRTPNNSSIKNKQSLKATHQYVTIVPLTTYIGQQIYNLICFNASNISLSLIITTKKKDSSDESNLDNNAYEEDDDETNDNSLLFSITSNRKLQYILQRLIIAYNQSKFIRLNSIIKSSFQGKTLLWKVISCSTTSSSSSSSTLNISKKSDQDEGRLFVKSEITSSSSSLTNQFKAMNINDKKNDDDDKLEEEDNNDDEISLLNCVQNSIDSFSSSNDNLLYLYRIGYDTKINFLTNKMNDSSLQQQERQQSLISSAREEASYSLPPSQLPTTTTTTTTKVCAGLDDTISHIKSLLLPPLLMNNNNYYSSNNNNNNNNNIYSKTAALLSSSLKPPRGILIYGPSGVGKTLVSKQIQLDIQKSDYYRKQINVISINCTSIQSKSLIVGDAENKLKEIFFYASEKVLAGVDDDEGGEGTGSGTLLILDDIHLICPKRGSAGTSGGADRLSATLLAMLDGIGSSSSDDDSKNKTGTRKRKKERNVMILGITSDPSLLDPALRRPGRLDNEIEIPIPNEKIRCDILKFQINNICSGCSNNSMCNIDANNENSSDGSGNPLNKVDVAGGDDDNINASSSNNNNYLSFVSDDNTMMSLSRMAKGFNGADCMLAVKEALRMAILRNNNNDNSDFQIRINDLRTAIRKTKPSSIKAITVEIPHVSWSSIGGMNYAKNMLRESIELPLTHEHLFTSLNIRPPRGVLLYGPPGCSKTLMARALATEGSMNFLAIKGPELLSKWLGESERTLATIFKRARMACPCIVFFDEIDAIASKRGSTGSAGGSSGGERLLSQLLTELDGISNDSQRNRVIVVGATNRPDLLDNALMRPGRIDRMIYVGLPDEDSRKKIIEIGLKDKACSSDINISELSKDGVTGGYSGAEIIAICREAALYAIEEDDNNNLNNNNDIDVDDSLGGNISSRLPVQICKRHLLQSIAGTKKQITTEMLDFYDAFSKT